MGELAYHSALQSKPKEDAPKARKFMGPFFEAYAHDIETGVLHHRMATCDFLYADIPWRRGYTVFNERAGKQGGDYAEFLRKVANAMRPWTKPVFITGPKEARKYLTEFRHKDFVLSPHKSSGQSSCTLYWKNHGEPLVEDTAQLLHFLFRRYPIGGDFACGYAYIARYALEHDRYCILTDINYECIGHIKENYQSWYEDSL